MNTSSKQGEELSFDHETRLPFFSRVSNQRVPRDSEAKYFVTPSIHILNPKCRRSECDVQDAGR